MNIISIDTITNQISITAEGENGTYTEIFSPKSRRHTESIIPMMDATIKQAGFKPTDIEIILCAEGPGAFTGLRSAYSTAKAIQLPTDAKIITIPTMECMAQLFTNLENKWNGQILTLLDAKRNRFYGQLFNKKIAQTKVLDESIENFISFCNVHEPCIIMGKGIEHIQNKVIEKFNAPVIFLEDQQIFSISMIQFFHQNKEKLMEQPENDYSAPVYIRKSDAEKPQSK